MELKEAYGTLGPLSNFEDHSEILADQHGYELVLRLVWPYGRAIGPEGPDHKNSSHDRSSSQLRTGTLWAPSRCSLDRLVRDMFWDKVDVVFFI